MRQHRPQELLVGDHRHVGHVLDLQDVFVHLGDVVHLDRDERDLVAGAVELLGYGKIHVDGQIVPVSDLLQDPADRELAPTDPHGVSNSQLELLRDAEPHHHVGLIEPVLPPTQTPVLKSSHLLGKDPHQGHGLVLEDRSLGEVGDRFDPVDPGDGLHVLIGNRLGQSLPGQHGDLLVGAPAPGRDDQMGTEDVGLLANLGLQAGSQGKERDDRRNSDCDG
jgi:hypothetical protein